MGRRRVSENRRLCCQLHSPYSLRHSSLHIHTDYISTLTCPLSVTSPLLSVIHFPNYSTQSLQHANLEVYLGASEQVNFTTPVWTNILDHCSEKMLAA